MDKIKLGLIILLLIVVIFAVKANNELSGYDEILNGTSLTDALNITGYAAFQAGYESAVIQLANLAATCEEVPINVENITFNIIAVDCLRQEQNN